MSDTARMPAGHECFNKQATDKQAMVLLGRIAKNPPKFGGPGGPASSCSHSEMFFYPDDGGYGMGVQFTEHLMFKDSRTPAYSSDGKPVYGRYFVTGGQIDAFMSRHPEDAERLAEALGSYGPAGAQYYTTAEPPEHGYCVRMDGVPASGLKLAAHPPALKLRFGENVRLGDEMRRVGPLLRFVSKEVVSAEKDAHPTHRVMFTMEKAPGAFRSNPVAHAGIVDAAEVEKATGFAPDADGKYSDGYLLTAQFAMDSNSSTGRRLLAGSWRERTGVDDEPPGSAYLVTRRVGGNVRHDIPVSPEFAARLLSVSKMVEKDGASYGVVNAPVRIAPCAGAMNTSDKEFDALAFDSPECRSGMQGVDCIKDFSSRPPKGTSYQIDLRSGFEGTPRFELNLGEHEKHAKRLYQKYVAWKNKSEGKPANSRIGAGRRAAQTPSVRGGDFGDDYACLSDDAGEDGVDY